jgi:thioredoxin-like negative regulator of GroEL
MEITAVIDRPSRSVGLGPGPGAPTSVRTALRGVLSIAAAVLALGCGRGATSPRSSAAAPAEPPPPELKTTSGEIATHNFRAELAQAERQHAEQPADLRRSRALVDRLFARAQFFGRLADYDEAEAVSKAALTAAPASGDAHLLRARTLAALHEFVRSRAELDRAAALGADPDAVEHARVGIWQATGDIDKALESLRAWRRARPNLTSYAAEAGALADKHDFPLAAAVFTEARRHYDDVSAFAVAWLEFQEGHMWETAGRSDRARPLFESALARLPGYAAAAGHLARLVAAFGDPDGLQRARALLEPLVAETDDPEYVGQLGALDRQQQRVAEGDRLVARAAQGYEALVARHPAAFYDHAARFFLHVGGDPQRALSLAQKNLAIRQTPDARDLLAEAERATTATARLDR